MASAPAGVNETGVPAFVVLGPEAMGLSAPPTDLQIMPDHRVLAISHGEIAFSDGVRWETFQAAEGQQPIVLQTVVAPDGKIYTGVEGGIARIDLGIDARWRLTRVAELPKPDFERSTLTTITIAAGQWYWYGGGGLVTWQPGQTPSGTRNVPTVERIFSVGNNAYIRDAGDASILRLNSDGSMPKVELSMENAGRVTVGIPFGEGRSLVGTISLGLQLFDGTTFTPFPTNGWAVGHRISDLCEVSNDAFAAAVDGVGIVFFNGKGEALQVLDRSMDHRLGRVRRVLAGGHGVVWGLLNEGVVRVDFPSPISHFEPLLASGLAYAKPVRYAGKLWVLGDGQAMRAIYTSNGRLERFEFQNPPGNHVFTLAELDGDLFAGTELGLYIFKNEEWKIAVPGIVNPRLTASTPRGIPYFAEGEYGFLQRTPDGFQIQRTVDPNLKKSYNAVTDAKGVVWLELGSARAARFNPQEESPKLQFFGRENGLTQGWVEIYLLDGIARIHLPNHLWRYDDQTGKLVEDRELIEQHPMLQDANGRPIIDPSGQLWYTQSGTAHVRAKDPNGVYTERKVPVHFGPFEYTVQEDGVLWFFANLRFSRLDLRVTRPPPLKLEAFITSVQYLSSNRRVFQPGSSLAALPYEDNSIVIHYAAPANPFSSPVSFQVLLEGSGTQWVSTGSVASASFHRLKEGNYTFRVRPVVGSNPPGAEARLSFSVMPPWYRTGWAWFSYVCVALGLFGFAAWFSSFLQRRENDRLERLVGERTDELNRTNVQLSRQIFETTEKSSALSSSEERYRILNTELEARVDQRTAELSLSNAELQQRESLFRLIFEHAPVGISWKRADLGGDYHLNATFRRILDLSGSSTEATPLASLIHPEDAVRQAKLHQSIQSGACNSYDFEARFVLDNGRIVWGSLSVAVVRDQAGRIVQDIGILEDITARKHAEEELAKTYKNLVDASRLAGMAEVATGVLHNVGNVLNSLNVSSNIVTETVRRSRVDGLVKLASLVNEHAENLGEFLTHDPKGKLVPGYLASLADHSTRERDGLLQEVASMQKNIDYIKEIVAMQQSHATAAGVIETISAAELFADALRMNSAELAKNDVTVAREFENVPLLNVEKGKVLQILVNLIRNAKHACDDLQKLEPREKLITLRIETNGADKVRLIVRDNGIGIPSENLTRIFVHGFTTRAYGHGFGLHSSALAAKEMKGSLTVMSEGTRRGATFVLDLPIAPERNTREFSRGKETAHVAAV